MTDKTSTTVEVETVRYRIDHKDLAEGYVSEELSPPFRDLMAPVAQVHAMLALVDEQRTANLIAWYAACVADGQGLPVGVVDQIEQRLELGNSHPVDADS